MLASLQDARDRAQPIRSPEWQAYLPSTNSIPEMSNSNFGRGSLPTLAVKRDLSREMICDTLATESFGKPVTAADKRRLPGASAHFRLLVRVQSQTLTTLHNFKGPPDGQNPWAGLLRDPAGNLYGTTLNGGHPKVNCGANTCGTVFKLSPNGQETVLHRFNGTDGAGPQAALILDGKGNLYGTT